MISRPARHWLPLAMLCVGSDAFSQQGAVAPAPLSAAQNPVVQTRIEEVIVSARRRDEDSQQVGLTLTSVGHEELQRGFLRNLPDLASSLSNVELFDDYGGQGLPVWVIRGVGLQDFNANNTPTAAVYVDEVYQSSSVQGGSGLFDTGRVEIIKGPQGGLYGRNTSGGVVRQLTRRASLQGNEGYVSAATGSWDDQSIEAATNQMLSETLAVRLAGRINRSQDAWQTSIPSGKTHGKKDTWDLRSWWLLEPSERSRFELKLYGGENDSELPLVRSIGLYDATGGFCTAVLAGRRDDANCLNYAGLVNVLTGADTPSLSPSIQNRNGSTSLSSPLNRLDNSHVGSTLMFTMDTAWSVLGSPQLQAISNVENFDYGLSFDYDGSGAELGHQITSSEIRTVSQELRLVSTAQSALNWQIGALLSREEFVEDRQFRLQDNIPVGLVHGQLDYEQVTRSRAAYALADYTIDDRWSATASLRYTKEWKTYRDGSVRAPAFPPPFDVVVSNLNGDYSLGSRWSGALGLNWQVSDNTLVYSSLSRGFKAGGFFGGFIFDPAEFAPYKEETVLAWESGFKMQRADDRLRLNAAVFYYDYRDVQGFANVETGPTGGASLVLERLTTLGDGEHSGVDVDLMWLPHDGWIVAASLGYLDARINSGGGTTLNILKQVVSTEGERAYAPHVSGSFALGNVRQIFDGFMLEIGASWHYRSDFSGTLVSPVEKAVSSLDAYALMDAYVTLTPAEGSWSLSLLGKNLHNKVYSPRKVYDSLGSYVEIMGQPRTWALQARYNW
ncbi:MAG: TonB-dependent receptor [Gammaproteobacteria bacterium]|nr:TonB-dependent receptor [Gammaproteobacteria bacterium]